MSIHVQCTNCSAKLNAPDSAAGKRVKCPKCAKRIVVPKVDDDVEDDDTAPRKTVNSVVAKKSVPIEPEDDDERPRKKTRRREEENDEDERPRKKTKADSKNKKGGVPWWVFAIAGVGLVGVIGVVATLVLTGGKPGALIGPGGVLGPTSPAGYTAVRDPEGGFTIFLSGEAKKVNASFNGQNVGELGQHGWATVSGDADPDGKRATIWSRNLPTGFNPGTDQIGLMKLLLNVDPGATDNKRFEVVGQRAVMIAGLPGCRAWNRKSNRKPSCGANRATKEFGRKKTKRNSRKLPKRVAVS